MSNQKPKADLTPISIFDPYLTRARHGLPPLEWSEELASIAQRRAEYLAFSNNCEMQHTVSEYGENLFWASAVIWSDGRREVQKISARHVVKAWADEERFYNYASNRCRAGKVCGHYTQIVWRDTRQLGCGMAICPNMAQIWVCVYYPPGNYVGMRPY